MGNAELSSKQKQEICEEEISVEKTNQKKRAYWAYTSIGYVATLLSIATYIPTVIDVFQTPEVTCSLNFWQYLIALISNLFWIVYAIGVASWPLFASSVVAFALILTVMIQKSLSSNLCPASKTVNEKGNNKKKQSKTNDK